MKLLVVHGITMTGPSMLTHLGALGERLQGAGFELIAPTAPCGLTDAQLQGQQRWLEKRYGAVGQDAASWFKAGVFWDGSGHHGDWFAGRNVDGAKVYEALEEGLQTIREAIDGQQIVGVVGFSQGAAMASVILGAMLNGVLPGGEHLRFGMLLSGFRPRFDQPALDVFPVPALPVFVLHGTEDPIFPDAEGSIAEQGAAFTGPVTTELVEGLGHCVPDDPAVLDQLMHFVERAIHPPVVEHS